MAEAILIIVALGGLEFTLWMLGRRQQIQQLEILESIHIQLLLRNAPNADRAIQLTSQKNNYVQKQAPLKAV